jgi:hypothetical protein
MRRRGIWILLALAALGAVGWTVAWRLSTNAVEQGVRAWFDQERTLGRAWDCESLAFSGFPFRIEAACARPSVVFAAAPVRKIEAGRFVAKAGVLAPARIQGALVGPAHITSDRGKGQATWTRFEWHWGVSGGAPDLRLDVSGLSFIGEGDLQAWDGSAAEALRARLRPAPDRAVDARVTEASFSAEAVKAPVLDLALGTGAPASIDTTALITRSDALASGGNGVDRLERWRLAEGRVGLSAFAASRGPSRIEGSGELGLDELRRPEGRLSVRLSGMEPFLKKMGIGSGSMAIEGMLRGMLAPAREDSSATGPAIPLNLRNGRVHLGPIRTPVALPPLY